MSRKHFQSGLNCYKTGNFEEALEELNKAVRIISQPNYLILDTRAAVYTKLGKTKEAFKDAKTTIEVAPERWHGYARAARLFLSSERIDASDTMIKLALDRIKEEDAERRGSLLALQAEIDEAARNAEKRRRRYTNHSANMPIEIFGEIVEMVVQEKGAAFISLSHVCRSWRSAIHNMPFVWHTLVLDRRNPKRKAKLWIERSRGIVRELDIRESIAEIYDWPSLCLQGLKWENLRILRTQEWDAMPYLRSIGKPDALAKIQQLDIGFSMYSKFPTLLPQQGYLSLTHFTLRSCILRQDNLDYMIHNLTNLRSLTMGDIDSVTIDPGITVSALIKANPMLETLSLDNVAIELESSEPFLQSLVSLELKRMPSRSALVAHFPLLRVLRIENAFPSVNNLLQHLSEKSTSYGSQLTEITLRSCPFKSNSLIPLLQNSPALQILEISNITGTAPNIVEALAASYSSNPRPGVSASVATLCPNLIDATFSKCSDLQTGQLVRMIRSRLPIPDNNDNTQDSTDALEQSSIKRITSLKIDECHDVDPAWLEWIRKNVERVSCVYMKKKTKFRA